MLPLLFPFVVDTVAILPPDFYDLSVNEWGKEPDSPASRQVSCRS